ncbi:MAG: hypothetical protein ACREKN_07175 [Longimicrobiaceae bacterium]
MRLLVGSISLLLLAAFPLAAQEEGVRLELEYQPEYQPGFVVLPFSVEGLPSEVGEQVRTIIRQDLDFSDRFELVEPGDARPGEPVDRALWQERGADWVLEGRLGERPDGWRLELTLHDAVYGQERERAVFTLPAGDYRMAVHQLSDRVVYWATGEPGMAASRIALVRQSGDVKEIFVVDSDGERLRQITDDGSIALSPAWSPDLAKIAYSSFREGTLAVYERDLRTGRDRVISDRDGINITPAYSPDGRSLAFAAWIGGNTEVVTCSALTDCRPQPLTSGRRYDSLSPTFSPDGRWIAFVSNRVGEPHIYVRPSSGEGSRAVTEYRYGASGYNTSPDWSPRGGGIAFSARVDGSFQIAVAEAESGRLRLLTERGRNEDPSWAPDGRHLVFASDQDGGGLFVLDTVSGRVRPLLRGAGYGLPAWSRGLRLP